jgi:hypothetical protein
MMRERFGSIKAVFVLLLLLTPLLGVSQTLTSGTVATNAQIVAVTGKGDGRCSIEALAVDPNNGAIYIYDDGAASGTGQDLGTDQILKIVPGNPPTITIVATTSDIAGAVGNSTFAIIDLVVNSLGAVYATEVEHDVVLEIVPGRTPNPVTVLLTKVTIDNASAGGASPGKLDIDLNDNLIIFNDDDFGGGDDFLIAPTTGAQKGTITSVIPKSSLTPVTADASIDDFDVSPDGSTIYGLDDSYYGGTACFLAVPTSGANASIFIDAATVRTSTGYDTSENPSVSSLAIDSDGNIYVWMGEFGGDDALYKIPTSGPSAGTINLWITSEAIQGLTGTIWAMVDELEFDKSMHDHLRLYGMNMDNAGLDSMIFKLEVIPPATPTPTASPTPFGYAAVHADWVIYE